MCGRAVIVMAAVLLASSAQAWGWTVPGSGVNTCYDNTGAIPCPSPGQPFHGQDGNLAQPHSLTDNGLTVTDNATGLTWQKTPDGVARDWATATSSCDQLDLDSQSDWRLPSQRELATIVGHSLAKPAFAPPLAGPNAFYWSATAYAGYEGPAWYVNFAYGVSEFNTKDNAQSVRCVRGPALPAPALTARGNVVLDAATGLTWQKSGSPATKTWQEALAYCQDSVVDGYTDWRMPTVMELRTLVDYTRVSPALDPVRFVNAGNGFWTGTTFAEHPELAWHVDFEAGLSAGDAKTAARCVRCVRTGPLRAPGLPPLRLLLQ